MACAGCEACGNGLFQVHVTFESNPGDIGVKVHELLDLMPDGKWKREWITVENIDGPERDARLAMRKVAAVGGALRQKIEVPVKKLLMSDRPLYVEAHVKMLLSGPNLEMVLHEGLYASVNANKPGYMILTFRALRYADLKEKMKDAKLERFLGFNREEPVKYEAAIFDDNPSLDDDWMPGWRTNSKHTQSPTWSKE